MIVLVVATGGAYLYGRSQSLAGISGQDKKSVDLYAQALNIVQRDYVDQKSVKPKKLTYAAIEAMLNDLGDKGHTRFLTPDEVKQNSQELSGKYVGVGIVLQDKGKKVVVTSPIPGSPADKAGMKSGDVLVAVDGKSVKGEDLATIAKKVRGPAGSKVEISVLRGGGEKKFSVMRTELKVPVAPWTIIPGSKVAQVQLTSFSSNSADALVQSFNEARKAGARRFILDLRNNPGGQVDQAIAIAGDFLKPGSVVYIRKDASGKKEKVRVPGSAKPTDAPLVVLVNNGSASSAEILAGALRDNNRAKVVGTKTFGTGTVLTEYTLKDGSAMLLGIAEWLTPNGDFIRKTGIKPGIVVKMKKGEEPLLPDEVKGLSRQKVFSKDAQLKRAFEVVQGQ
ncbi:MAG: S41 family peptidase [Rubrobacteraceae bacterium]